MNEPTGRPFGWALPSRLVLIPLALGGEDSDSFTRCRPIQVIGYDG